MKIFTVRSVTLLKLGYGGEEVAHQLLLVPLQLLLHPHHLGCGPQTLLADLSTRQHLLLRLKVEPEDVGEFLDNSLSLASVAVNGLLHDFVE